MESAVVEDVGRTMSEDEWRAWFVAGIQRGLDDIEAGRTISNEEFGREMEALLDELERSGE